MGSALGTLLGQNAGWLLLAVTLVFAAGWFSARRDGRSRTSHGATRDAFRGLNLLLSERQDDAIDAFIQAAQSDPEAAELHFALGNLFRRRGEYERAVRVHRFLLAQSSLTTALREQAQMALSEDYRKAGLFDHAERELRVIAESRDSPHRNTARLALLSIHERLRDWRGAAQLAEELQSAGVGAFAQRIAHYHCEQAEAAQRAADAAGQKAAITAALQIAPFAPRALLLLGEQHLALGEHGAALQAWRELMTQAPAFAPLVARPLTRLAQAAESAQDSKSVREEILTLLRTAQTRSPGMDWLEALMQLEPDAEVRLRWNHEFAARDEAPLLAAAYLAREEAARDSRNTAAATLAQILQRETLALWRYRCASCGFEVKTYFWQCPGCLNWDSFPARRAGEM